ncbi:hypothetical protein ApDm4_2455 [Acetobacter pomorum]|nr:hypothetical protein ApDm4_2455 [Acetobacter pomorum]
MASSAWATGIKLADAASAAAVKNEENRMKRSFLLVGLAEKSACCFRIQNSRLFRKP